jgi:hypothetical protein
LKRFNGKNLKSYILATPKFLCSILPLLYRPEFSKGIDAFLQSDQVSNAPWYALYNAVLALGCRAIQMTESIESPSSFQDSENVAWQYFYNAFGVHTELLYHKDNYIAIEVSHCLTIFLLLLIIR